MQYIHYQRRFQGLYIIRFNDTIKISLFNIVWLNFYHWNDMFLTLYILLSLHFLFKLLTMIWLMTWQWKLYKLTHCGLNNLVGMRNIHHRAMHDLKTYFVTLTSHSSLRVWSWHCLVFLWPLGLACSRL